MARVKLRNAHARHTVRFGAVPKSIFYSTQQLYSTVGENRLICNDVLSGTFQIDFGTIYKQLNHQVHHKWAPLSKDDANNEGDTYVNPKGYVKCDFLVMSKGDKIEVNQDRFKT